MIWLQIRQLFKCQQQLTFMQNQILNKASTIKVCEKKDWQCTPIQKKYELSQKQLGHGTYGSVYKGINLQDQKYYALKKMENIEDKSQLGFPITTLREVKLLQGLNHPNILNIKQVVFQKAKNYKQPPVIYLCLDLMECDLSDLIKSKQSKITMFKIQQVLKQMLRGLQYLHQLNIAHRDIKPSNVLINQYGQIKIADFGLAKKLHKLSTTKVVTLWYRAPQLLLGIKGYSPKVDIWSVGCLAAELLILKPLFQQQHNQTQIMKRIFQLMGTPDNCGWQAQLVQDGKNYEQLKPNFSCSSSIVYHLRTLCPEFEHEFQLFDLIQKMLRLNHQSRLTAGECLQHQFFQINYPYESILSPSFLQQKKSTNEYDDNPYKKIKI